MKRALLMLLVCCGAGSSAQQPANSSKQASSPAKHVAQAKTHQEFNDYNTAYATAGGAAAEKAADEFAAKYPASELKIFLYEKAMHDYQNESNPAKMLTAGDKVLQIDPDNSIALVLTATVLADSLSDSDKDREQKIAHIKQNATHALETVDSAFVPPANATVEQITTYKKTLQSMAHSALGITALKLDDNVTAEKELQLAAQLTVTQPDPYVWYHLALAQDHQKKYDEALVSVNRALQYSASNADLSQLAKGEQKRLETLTSGSAPK